MSGYAEGKYDCIVVAQGFGTAGVNETMYFGIEIMPTAVHTPEGPLDIDNTFTRTIKLWMNSDDNVARSRERLESLGWEGGKFKDLEPGGGFDLTNTMLTLVNKHTTSPDGKVWDDFDFPYDGNGGGPTMSNDNSIAAKLDRMYKPAGKKSKAPVTTVVTEEETPF
jgi:hypothetical protein